MKNARLYTRTWMKPGTLRRSRLLDTIRDHEAVLDGGFMEAVTKRRSSVFSALLKAYALQVPIFVFLVLSFIPIEASFSLFGVTPTSNKNLREILVVLSALIGVAIGFLNYYYESMSEILAAYAERKSKGNKDVESVLRLGFGLDAVSLPPRSQGHIQLGWGYLAFVGLFLFLIVGLALIVAAGGFYIHVMVLLDIYQKPSFSTTVSLAVIAFVLGCDLLTVMISVFNSGPVIARNFTNLMAVAKMDEAKSQAIYVGMWQRHYRKPFLLRILTRAKLPRKLS